MKHLNEIMNTNTVEENLYLVTVSLKKTKFLTEILFDYFKAEEPDCDRLLSDYENCKICALLLTDEMVELLEEFELLKSNLHQMIPSLHNMDHFVSRLLHYFSAPNPDTTMLRFDYAENKINLPMLIDKIVEIQEVVEQLRQAEEEYALLA